MNHTTTYLPDAGDPAVTCLVAGLRRAMGAQAAPAKAAATSGDPDDATIEQATALATRAKVLSAFAAGMSGHLTPTQAARLEQAEIGYKTLAFHKNGQLLRHMARIAQCLGDAGLPFAVYKGPVQQKQIHGQYFERPSSDVDVLVRRKDFVTVARRLEAEGFRIAQELSVWWRIFVGQDHLYDPDMPTWSIDLHHRLQEPGMQQPLSSEAFLTDLETQTIMGAPVPVIRTELVPLICAMNLVKGLSRRLDSMAGVSHKIPAVHVLDLYIVLDRGAPDRIRAFLEMARAHRLEGTAALSLRVLNAVFGIDLGGLSKAPMAEVDDARLTCMVFNPGILRDWPRPGQVLIDTWDRQWSGLTGDYLWYMASETVRKIARGRALLADRRTQHAEPRQP